MPAHRATRRTRRFRVAALGGLTLLAAVGPGAGAALAAGPDKDCSDFAYQDDAQAVYDDDTTDPHRLDGNDDDGLACEALPHRAAITDVSTVEDPDSSTDHEPAAGASSAGSERTAERTSGATSGPDRDCADFDSQGEAQAALDAEPGDPDGLDADDDGLACESFTYADEVETEPAAVVSGDETPSTVQAGTAAYPVGGVAAGDGSAPQDASEILAYGLLGSAALAGAVGARHALTGGRHRRA